MNSDKIIQVYVAIKEAVRTKGYEKEIEWQSNVVFDNVTESYFLREVGWVVLSAGMREIVIRRKFAEISAAFCHWKSAGKIQRNSEACRAHALSIFNHEQKIDAILVIAKRISSRGFKNFKKRVEEEGVAFISQLPFMGPATSFHLAKNIGLDFAKPDRHLLRISAAAGFPDPGGMCKTISERVGDSVAVVDLVMWRFATLCPDYLEFFRPTKISSNKRSL